MSKCADASTWFGWTQKAILFSFPNFGGEAMHLSKNSNLYVSPGCMFTWAIAPEVTPNIASKTILQLPAFLIILTLPSLDTFMCLVMLIKNCNRSYKCELRDRMTSAA
jgi:hypothetical protein